MKIKILGSGGWEGIPSPFCKCRVCLLAIKDIDSKEFRTRPEFLVEGGSGSFLFEISPDIRYQSVKFNLPPIKDFLISHWHFDHMYGLLELHAWSEFVMNKAINIYCSKKTKGWLDKNFAYIPKNIHELTPYKPFELFGLKITPVSVFHMKWQDDTLSEEELMNTFGYVLEEKKKKIVYLADYYRLPKKTLELIINADVLIADGTYLFENLYPDKNSQNELKKDTDHLHGEKILNFTKSLNAKRTVFHSITHLSEKTHDHLQSELPHGFELAYDGLELI